ncbi:hypothetical protein [Microbacterium sp. 77mftsu3.1]|uniref:hypothetical protein n=1 Tax=Microbacterium sp. 77mftsu3.1 TaxID=1761802 RepID=UPI000361930D|nr:hypothetical protein [Microbacterium sp. 77mftsu3.1]SDH40184.1 hypothetical protein SAMN04488590_3247 [Microbacterium sp. 77mftsu3.1]
MTDLTPAQIAEREAARAASGEFGTHERTAPEVTIKPHDGYPNAAVHQFANLLRERGEDDAIQAAIWLREHGEDDAVAQVVGKLLDRFEDIAKDAGTAPLDGDAADRYDWDNELPRQLAAILEDRGSREAAAWVHENEWTDEFWVETHHTVDRLDELAAYDR